MSETPKLLMEKDGPIGWIIFNQPEKRNAVSQEMWQAMPEYVHELVTDDAIRVVVLRGAGEQAFVAGADISQFKDRRRNMADEEEYRRISASGHDALATLSKPLLAMIHGYCVGGGRQHRHHCDIRIAVRRRSLRHPRGAARPRLSLLGHGEADEAGRAVVHQGDLLHRPHRLQRPGRAPHGAREPGRAQGRARELHAKVRADHRPAMPRSRSVPPRPRSSSSCARAGDRDLALLDKLIADCFNSQDYQEGVKAFSEKRRPQFQGR